MYKNIHDHFFLSSYKQIVNNKRPMPAKLKQYSVLIKRNTTEQQNG